MKHQLSSKELSQARPYVWIAGAAGSWAVIGVMDDDTSVARFIGAMLLPWMTAVYVTAQVFRLRRLEAREARVGTTQTIDAHDVPGRGFTSVDDFGDHSADSER
jgi:hypothetical protein